MDNFLSLCAQRRSVRSYSSQPIPEETLQYIMECARLAPSAVNFQPWKFIAVCDEAGREQLQKCYSREWFVTAPMYLIICRDTTQEWVRKLDGKPHGDIDVAIATEHICLAAAEKGLGTCWVCNFNVALCKDLFSLPAHLEPVVLLPIGYPNDEETPKKRKAPEEIFEKR